MKIKRILTTLIAVIVMLIFPAATAAETFIDIDSNIVNTILNYMVAFPSETENPPGHFHGFNQTITGCINDSLSMSGSSTNRQIDSNFNAMLNWRETNFPTNPSTIRLNGVTAVAALFIPLERLNCINWLEAVLLMSPDNTFSNSTIFNLPISGVEILGINPQINFAYVLVQISAGNLNFNLHTPNNIVYWTVALKQDMNAGRTTLMHLIPSPGDTTFFVVHSYPRTVVPIADNKPGAVAIWDIQVG